MCFRRSPRRVLSARAEVGRTCGARRWCGARALRASGGGSTSPEEQQNSRSCSPRERRWVASPMARITWADVLSARAEVGRWTRYRSRPRTSALRASGGGSYGGYSYASDPKCSPRERRWVGRFDLRVGGVAVLSARAEVGRTRDRRCPACPSALRASGGGSLMDAQKGFTSACSPRERRWVAAGRRAERAERVLSARAEVGPAGAFWLSYAHRALRASGGGSIERTGPSFAVRCSPRERRWVVAGPPRPRPVSVLSARAEVGRRPASARRRGRSALRASGGGSSGSSVSAACWLCSPRERRWVVVMLVPALPKLVLSARAEVGRKPPWALWRRSRALRASGGGSSYKGQSMTPFQCSPRERRWVGAADPVGADALVLSARAEVGRRATSSGWSRRSALRASGGGSARGQRAGPGPAC